MSHFNTLTTIQKIRRNARIGQRAVKPAAIKNISLGEVILERDTDSASATIGNNVQILLTHTISQANNAKMFAIPDISIYIGSVSANNQLPGGSAIDESEWQVIGPWNDWGTTDNKNSKTKIYVRNISAGSSTVLFRVKSRFITNRQDSTSSTG